MPLRDALPRLDDRRYADIVEEIRTRVARYTPEWNPAWNDLNDSDPGVTLTQVFAWLSEMMLYRMQRVPELHYVKFLELLGVELEAAQSALAQVSFALAAGTAASGIVPPRTQVSATGADGKPVVFETVRALTVAACELRSVQAYDGAQYRDATAENSAASAGFTPFGDDPRDDAALTLGWAMPAAWPTPEQFPALTLDLTFWTAPQPGQARSTPCGPASRAFAPAQLVWEGFDGARWVALDVRSDDTLAFTRSGRTVLRLDPQLKLARAFVGAWEAGTDPATGAARPPLFWLRARLARTQYTRAPRLLALRTNTVDAEQAETMVDEVLGGATGRRNQRWQFANTPVLREGLVVEIDDGTGFRRWQVEDDLLGAGREDEALALNPASGELTAGDGENGAIPVANAANPDANVVARSYRYGGGTRGNVAAGAIKTLLTPVAGIDGGKTANLFAASGGRDEERLDQARKRARGALRARTRAVTGGDFEHFAAAVGEVARAKALPLAHPAYPGVQVPGAVTLIVVPDAPGAAPEPSEALLRNVCASLDRVRLLTTELAVTGPRYVRVAVAMDVVADDGADPSALRDAVAAAVSRWLHPITGGDAGDGWPFGGAIRYSKLVQRVFTVAGVDSVPRLVLNVEGEERPECRDVDIATFSPHALIELTAIDITPFTREEAGEASAADAGAGA
ncbi:putative baseplate assembly protein [Ramlibacter sp. PS3R-8]|uniref:putative baseplate assembly protein n=1 Tax=Ramlibacter sp. PS3R-8 TaxID=3133437 RepID=UPI0030B39F67